jgi:uncharacterized protein (TIGR00297 family)
MTQDGTLITWSKAIPAGRDRLQSRVLVWIVVPLIFAFSVLIVYLIVFSTPPHHLYLIQSCGISITFALLAWTLRSATPAASLCGGMICLTITVGSGYTASSGEQPWHSGLVPLIALFLFAFAATRAGRRRKVHADLAESRKGRSAYQVIANLGVAALWAWPFGSTILWSSWAQSGSIDPFWALGVPMLAALAEATADTVSSEIGQAFGGTPFMLTTLRRVPPGTDGAISLLGTIAGIAAAALIAATGAPALGLSPTGCAVAFAAGVAGLFFDSLLGATVERKGWIGNDLVNFLSTAFAAGVSLLAIRFAQNTLLH